MKICDRNSRWGRNNSPLEHDFRKEVAYMRGGLSDAITAGENILKNNGSSWCCGSGNQSLETIHCLTPEGAVFTHDGKKTKMDA